MPNPILPLWEYIPDGEPRVFGDRVYLYGSHDQPGADEFCDFKLKSWSASVDDLNNWQCHGDIFRTKEEGERPADTDWTHDRCFAPDVVENNGKYYLYAYIVGAKGAICVADKPEGPFKCLGSYIYDENTEVGDNGIFIDPGVLVDDDGKVYVYYGYQNSFMNQLESDMRTVVKGSYMNPVMPYTEDIPQDERFFEAASPRKINGKYYLIYSPRTAPRLAYAISDSPTGPFTYKGYIVENSDDYPGGNDHGSLMCIKGQWYIFYHRMTNNSIMSRRACVEKVTILPDGTIPPVEMTSLGFEDALNPYKITPADIACVLKNCYITEKDLFTRVITNITDGAVIGYKYFDFGDDFTGDSMTLGIKVRGMGTNCTVRVMADGYDEKGTEIGTVKVGLGDGIYKGKVKNLTGRHSIFFIVEHGVTSWTKTYFDGKQLCEIQEFVFMK